MAAWEKSASPLARCCIHCTRHERISLPIRSFTTSARRLETTEETSTPSSTEGASPPPPPPTTRSSAFRPLDPNRVRTTRGERLLWEQQGLRPIGSRRRRAAIATTDNIPFEQLPYQCFQEARKILQQDRAEVVESIRVQRERLERLAATDVPQEKADHKEKRMRSMRMRLEELKIFADINDPLVKKKFEDGLGDMNKPIYRHLADLKWRSYQRKILVQRIEQMHVVPDILPALDPTVKPHLSFGPRNVPHGDFVDSRVSEIPPTIDIQPYDAGTRLLTIAVVTPDVPHVAADAFESRCHFLASNIPISPTSTRVSLGDLDPETQVVLPWLPPYSQKGAPYQRLAVIIYEQPTPPPTSSSSTPGNSIVGLPDPASPPSRSAFFDLKDILAKHPRFTQRNLRLNAYGQMLRLKPVGADLFRSQWDEGTAGVMQRLGVPGSNVEFKRKRVEPAPYKRLKGERYR